VRTIFNTLCRLAFWTGACRKNGQLVTRYRECGVTHREEVPAPGVCVEATMLHREWCSVDVRNITHRLVEMRV
jgi:hypothetical protein